MKKRYWSAAATLIGTTIGAGILGIPYAVAKAGFFTGTLDIIFLCILIIVISLYLAEIVLRTKGNHQITGLAGKYLGRSGKLIMFFSVVFSVVGSMVAYTYGSGDAITSILGGNNFFNSIIFFTVLAFVFYFGIKIFEKFEAYATIGILVIIFLIFITSFSLININNLKGFEITKIFVPYGVVLFASTGILAVPEMKKELDYKKNYKKAVILGVSIPALIYIIFSAAVIGVTGTNTTPVATVGLNIPFVHAIGNLLAVFVMGTSFVSMGFALKDSFVQDYKINNFKSWLAVVLIPLTIIFFQVGDFIKMMEYSAVIGTGVIMVCIMMMHTRAKKLGDRNPEFELKESMWLKILISILLIIGAVLII